jgi:hypothetical protein
LFTTFGAVKSVFSSILLLALLSFSGGIVCQCADFWASESQRQKKELASEDGTDEESPEEDESEEEAAIRIEGIFFAGQSSGILTVSPAFSARSFYAVSPHYEQCCADNLFSPPEFRFEL